MNISKAKKNLIAFMVGLPAIVVTSLSTTGNGSAEAVWDWLTSAGPAEAENFISDKTQTRVVDLTGQWLFAIGDALERAQPDFDDSSWDTLNVPSYWEDEGYDDYDGYAWYRRKFTVDSKELNKALFAQMGRIDDTDEIFINGYKIGGLGHFPPNYLSAWDKHRTYPVPKGLIKAGENVMAVRVYDVRLGGGISDGKIGLYASNLPQPLINLQGEWQFKTGDNADWKNANIDEPGFQNIQVPAIWEHQGHDHYNGYAWYRKTFGALNVSPDETLVLLLGKIDDTDEVFLNGGQIGGTGNLDHTDRRENPDYYAIPRRYEFPASLLKNSNTLAVRVHDSMGDGGIYAGPIGIMTKTDYVDYQQQLGESRQWKLSDTVDWLLGRE